MSDIRNPLAKARDDWMFSEEGKQCACGTTSGQYLRNRLEAAFVAGWNACESSTIDAIPDEVKP